MHNGGEGTADADQDRVLDQALGFDSRGWPDGPPPGSGTSTAECGRRLQVLQRLAPRQARTGPLGCASGMKAATQPRLGAGVVAQGPADGLADEELPAVRRDRRRGPRRTVEVPPRSSRASSVTGRSGPSRPDLAEHRPCVVPTGRRPTAHSPDDGSRPRRDGRSSTSRTRCGAARRRGPTRCPALGWRCSKSPNVWTCRCSRCRPVPSQGQGGVALLAELRFGPTAPGRSRATSPSVERLDRA